MDIESGIHFAQNGFSEELPGGFNGIPEKGTLDYARLGAYASVQFDRYDRAEIALMPIMNFAINAASILYCNLKPEDASIRLKATKI